jgi:DnaJ family protein C protein 7
LKIQNANAVKHFFEAAEVSYNSGDHRKVVYLMDRCLQHSTNCMQFQTLKAECLALLGRYQEAQEIAKLAKEH